MQPTPVTDNRRRPPLLGDRFVVVRWIGKGAAAHVYLGYDLHFSSWCALKVMHPKVAADDTMRRRFDREARTMALIDDPHVVRVLDREQGSLPYLAMEYVGGGGVLDWLRVNGPMPPRMAVRVARDVARGLVATHRTRVVHRDIKPHNVLIGLDGVCRITDFGIAKTLDDSLAEKTENHEASIPEGLTRVGTAMGTASFMPPEQQHDASSVDERADIYALGSTLFTLLQRKAATDLYVTDADDPQMAGIPPSIVEVILKACRYQPADRYPSAVAMADALEALVDELPEDPPGVRLVVPKEQLPDGPPERIDREHAPELMELVASGSVRAWSAEGIGGTLDAEDYNLTPMASDRAGSPVARLGPARHAAADADEETEEGSEPKRHAEAATLDAEASAETAHVAPDPHAPALAEPSLVPKAVAGLLVALLVFFGATFGVASQSAASVREAREAQEASVTALIEAEVAGSLVVRRLAAKGADKARIEDALGRLRQAKADQREVEALAYAELIQVQRDAVASRFGPQPEIDALLAPIETAQAEAERARQALDGAQSSPGAYLAGVFGLL